MLKLKASKILQQQERKINLVLQNPEMIQNLNGPKP